MPKRQLLSRLKIPYVPDIYPHCRQTTTYLLSLDHGSIDIVRAIAVVIGKKGINVVHPRKEMECKLAPGVSYEMMISSGMLTSNQVGNLTRPRAHGLIAPVRTNAGNYCLTGKGIRFLKGESIPRFAIMSKSQNHQIGYYLPSEYTVNIADLSWGDYWEGINYDIVEGRVVKDLPEKK